MRRFKVYRTYLQKFITIALANRPAQMKKKFKVIQKSSRLMNYAGFYSYLNKTLQQNNLCYLMYSLNMHGFKV